jgi:hypothetical protein
VITRANAADINTASSSTNIETAGGYMTMGGYQTVAFTVLAFDVIFRTDYHTFFIDISVDGFFGSRTEWLSAQRFRQVKFEDPKVATK